jgi:hypothetical protein
MGEVKVELELENAVDRGRLLLGEIRPEQLRSARIQALADSGAMMLVLPQDLVEALGLLEVGKAIVTYADERKEERPLAGIVTVRGKSNHQSQLCRRPAKQRTLAGPGGVRDDGLAGGLHAGAARPPTGVAISASSEVEVTAPAAADRPANYW